MISANCFRVCFLCELIWLPPSLSLWHAHNIAHFREHSTHCLALSLADLSVWCYACDKYVKSSGMEEVLHWAQQAKFPDDCQEQNSSSSVSSGGSEIKRVADEKTGVCYDPRTELHVYDECACKLPAASAASDGLQIHAPLARLECPDRLKAALTDLGDAHLLSRCGTVPLDVIVLFKFMRCSVCNDIMIPYMHTSNGRVCVAVCLSGRD